MAGIKRDIIFRQVLANLNASPQNYSGAASADEEYDDFAVMDAILNQEAFLLHKIAESRFNGNRTNETGLTDVVSTVTVANGALLPRHIGPVLGVLIDGLPGKIASAAEVARLRGRNPLNLTLTAGLYGLEDNRLYFTTDNPSVGATVYLYQYVRPIFTSIASFKNSDTVMPSEYHQAWIDLSTGAVMPREGDLMQASQMYINRGMASVGAELERENRPRAFTKDTQMQGE